MKGGRVSTAPSSPVPDLEIHGATEGSIHYAGDVIVGRQGAVAGAIHARSIVVEGVVTGDLHAEALVRILAGAAVTGDVKAPRIAVDGAARLAGRVTMRRSHDPAPVIDDSAVEAMLTAPPRR